jgi:plastocyanin
MGNTASRVWKRVGAWFPTLLLVACGSQQTAGDPPLLQPQIRLSAAKTEAQQESVSVHGRLISKATGLPLDSAKNLYVVDITTQHANDKVGRKTPSLLTRTRQGFSPKLCVVPVGARVRFDNRDKIFHTFFSSSEGNEFDLAPLDPGNSAFVRFQQPGMVHVYCSQHSGHRGSILVVPSPTYARVNANGEFYIADLTPGSHVLQLWGQDKNRQVLEIFVTGRETSAFEFRIQSIPAKAGR